MCPEGVKASRRNSISAGARRSGRLCQGFWSGSGREIGDRAPQGGLPGTRGRVLLREAPGTHPARHFSVREGGKTPSPRLLERVGGRNRGIERLRGAPGRVLPREAPGTHPAGGCLFAKRPALIRGGGSRALAGGCFLAKRPAPIPIPGHPREGCFFAKRPAPIPANLCRKTAQVEIL